MYKSILLFTLSAVFLAFAMACDKDDNDVKQGSSLEYFTHLEADSDTVKIGESTKIRAIYAGKDVTFEWDVTSGNLVGSGEEIEYHVAICDLGLNTITCTAQAQDTSITHSIGIMVVIE